MTRANNTEQRRLHPIVAAAGRTVVVQETGAAVCQGVGAGGADYLCGHCKQIVILDNISEGVIWDLAFHCFACGGLNASSQFPTGKPLPRPRWVIDEDEIAAPWTVELGDVVVVGRTAYQRRLRETGQPPRTPTRLDERTSFEQLVARVQQLLSAMFDDREQSARLGRAARATPPRHPHRLT